VHTYDFLTDPRAIDLADRHRVLARMDREQTWWLARLQALTESPAPEHDFPAFLLATPPFADLAKKLAPATSRRQLDAATADELDWFVRAFRDYLRTSAGEDVFSSGHRGSLEH
jgi:hypothetical protein